MSHRLSDADKSRMDQELSKRQDSAESDLVFDANSPSFNTILLACSPHMQGIVLMEASAIDLLRLAMTSKPMREIAHRELRRRTVDVLFRTIRSEYETLLVVSEAGERVERVSIIEPRFEEIGWPDRHDAALHPYMTLLFQLATYCRVGLLELQQNDAYDLTIGSSAWEEDKWDSMEHDYKIVKLCMSLDRTNLALLQYFSPHTLILKYIEDEGTYYDEDEGPTSVYSHRGFQDAETLIIDDRMNRDTTPAQRFLPLLYASVIDLRLHSKLLITDVNNFIRQWQNGKRSIVSFTCRVQCVWQYCAPHPKNADDIHVFHEKLIKHVLDCDEVVPFPPEQSQHINVVKYLVEMDGQWTASREEPKAVRVTRELDDRALIVVFKQYEIEEKYIGLERYLGLGIYEELQ